MELGVRTPIEVMFLLICRVFLLMCRVVAKFWSDGGHSRGRQVRRMGWRVILHPYEVHHAVVVSQFAVPAFARPGALLPVA